MLGSLPGKLVGKVAIITGGASGIGKATAQEFINHGARVVLLDTDADSGHKAVTELGPESAAEFIQCDVSVESQVAAAIDATVSRHGKLDIMFNNAGVVDPLTPPSIIELDLKEFERIWRVNVQGMVIGVKHASRVMVPQRSGSIVCTSSIAGLMGGIGLHAYSISKSAVFGVVKSAAAELCKYGVRINCVTPGAVPTPMTTKYMEKVSPGITDEEIEDVVNGFAPLKGVKCEVMDVAKAVLYLACDDSKYMTAQNLVLDGGFISVVSHDK